MTTMLLCYIFFIISGEVVIHILFFLIGGFIGKPNSDKISGTTILKGVLERSFIVTTLHFNIVQAITFLGALKVATRIKDTDNKVSNDFFLIGNLISVFFGIGYYKLLELIG